MDLYKFQNILVGVSQLILLLLIIPIHVSLSVYAIFMVYSVEVFMLSLNLSSVALSQWNVISIFPAFFIIFAIVFILIKWAYFAYNFPINIKTKLNNLTKEELRG